MILGFLLDNEPLCNSCAWGIQPRALEIAIVIDYDDFNSQQLTCSWCSSVLLNYAGLISESDLVKLLTSD